MGLSEELARLLAKHLKISEEDALVAAIFALSGFTLDAHLFPAGMPPATVTILSAAAGFLASRWLHKRAFFQSWVLGRIDKFVKKGHLTDEKASEIKARIIAKWTRDSLRLDDTADGSPIELDETTDDTRTDSG